MALKVKIFYSDEAKKKAGVQLKTKKLAQGPAKNKNTKGTPIKKVLLATPKRRKGKVVKSAGRPIQKITNASKIVQPTKGGMQPKNTPQKPKAKAQKKPNPRAMHMDSPDQKSTSSGKGRGAQNQGMRSAPSSSEGNQNKNQNQMYSNHGNTTVQTAQVIAANNSHPKHKDVSDLLTTLQKGWIDQKKFDSLLQGLLF